MIIRGAETTSLHLLLQRSEDLLYRIWCYFCQFQYSLIQTTLIMIVKLVNQYWISIKLSWGDICRGNETIYCYVLLCITCRYSCKWWLAGGTLQDGLLGSVFQVIWYWQTERAVVCRTEHWVMLSWCWELGEVMWGENSQSWWSQCCPHQWSPSFNIGIVEKHV